MKGRAAGDVDTSTPARPPRSRAAAIATVGFAAGAALIVALGFLAGLLRDRSTIGEPAPIRIVAPASGESVRTTFTLRFRTSAPLHLDPALGWTADGLHLHLMIDGREVMPAAVDIVREAETWAWTVAGLEPGSRRLHLTWAGREHRDIGGGSDTIFVRVLD